MLWAQAYEYVFVYAGVHPCVVQKGFPAFPVHLRMRPVSQGNSRRATWVGLLPEVGPEDQGTYSCVATHPSHGPQESRAAEY